ncbi:MAG: DNA polymerase III subunit alpha [Candidatus Terrybacteria bacterium RIFCSPLOWO2_01_FULL_44_24]|uniref:DNA polymerase III subunit alpha n=1 Tax=Candidatus Terrybacteria bacterium RIFCSPHIGHO2_01_FULL_43_35 TaxID=1802361 RepID=A0A1G2PDT1_9BACT|nr:MAG: DNA polymerase III subunit alpha [Candidatus Terrybacteria bacterium RIFCSPHIGHO2_01_FULL_43_35]OHA51496.1 MAG: DNA polymerase III subunit alpha [Candidatus Terrybacteria bacterium RIFCSPLOWO2_01_FULL_44_24]
MTSVNFVHLHTHSHYSLLDGLAKIDALVARAKELGFPALAITDHGALYGAIEFYKKAKAQGIKPIIGIEMYLAVRGMLDRDPKLDSKRFHITLLAKDLTGYKNLLALTSKSHIEGFYYKPRIDKNVLREFSSGLIALSGCLSGEIPRAILAGDRKRAEGLIAEYKEIFGADNFFLELGAHDGIEEQQKVNQELKELGRKFNVPLVGTNDIHYIAKDDKDAHEILISVQTASRFDDEGRLSMRQDDFSMKSAQEMAEFFRDTPEAIENTLRIADMVNLDLPLGQIQLPEFPLDKNTDANLYLKSLCYAGLKKRYGLNVDVQGNIIREENNVDAKAPPLQDIQKRLEYELSIIEKTGFASYFLIVQDIVNWAKSQNIVVGPGRGSAAGSLVAFLLNITNIDPLKFGLIFERFLNPDRISMPDIDLDFADTRRDEVLSYAAEKYGRDRVAQIITFGTMAARGVIRDAGRSLGYPYATCDRLAKMIPFNMNLEEALETSKELADAYASDSDTQRLLDAAKKLEGVARHASTHACGVVISREPLQNQVPLQRSSQDDGSIITQYEMHAIEDLGLLKMDFLGLRNLSIIEDTVNRIRDSRGETIDIENLALDDKKTFELLAHGDTTGVFQLESGGMKRYLKELKPSAFEDIIAMVSLYRPGPMELIPEYIARKHGRKPVTYMLDKLIPILEKTYGIAVYQEQIMEIARSLAGFTLSEADTLRKAVGKKIKSLLDEQRNKLMSGMLKQGIQTHTAQAIWEWFEPFARYGFNRSHAACYALIAYQTAYLKAYYPYEFMAALLTAENKTIERTATLIGECRAKGIKVLAPNVNISGTTFTVEYALTENKIQAQAIRFGLGAIKNVGENILEYIIKEREMHGSFASIENFAERIPSHYLNKKSVESLIKAGALDDLGERAQLLTNVEEILRWSREIENNKKSGQESLFAGTSFRPKLKLKEEHGASKDLRLRWEKELLGLWISDHPLSEYGNVLSKITVPIQTITSFASGKRIKIGGIINKIQKIITKKGDPMLFVNIEDQTQNVEVLVFPRTLEQYGGVFHENAIITVEGTLNDRDGEMKIICDRAEEIINSS